MNFTNRSIIFVFSFFILVQSRASSNIEEAFTYIYNEKIWGVDQYGNGTSGSGSAVQAAAPYIDFLKKFLKKYEVKSVVDFGCGDWSFSQYIDWSGISYTGYDVVKEVIERNNNKFAYGDCVFIHADGIQINLPSADLLICKDVLQHLSNDSISAFLKQCKKFKYCLITNDINDGFNQDSPEGGYRPLDLTKAPFWVPGLKIFTYMGCPQKEVLLIVSVE